MSATFDERAAAVERLANAAHASPRLYRLRVVAWIVLGYALIATLLGIALLLSAGVIAAVIAAKGWMLVKFAWIPVVFSYMLVRALFVRLEPPTGRLLRRREAPRLFAAVDEIRKHTGVPKLDGILVVPDMNAAVVETPRFGGLFGWHRHLLVGLPMLLTLSAEEMKAVLAHELGHLSGRHGRLAGWSWRVRVSWSRLHDSVGAQHGAMAKALRTLVQWYFDRLMPLTLVQARAQERAADQVAAELTTRETAARALAWLSVAEELVDRRFWKPLWDRIAEQPAAPAHPLHDLLLRRAEVLAPPFDDVLDAALARQTGFDDTHPSLAERLRSLGVERPVLAPPATFAAEEFFGRTAAALVAEVDREWRAAVGEQWRRRHEELAEARKLVEAATVDPNAPADDETLHKRAESLSELGRDEEAYPIYEELAARNPNDARAAFQLGRILVQRGDLKGLTHLGRAMEHDWRSVVPACELAYTALRQQGREKDADAWGERYRQQVEVLERAQAESGTLTVHDDLVLSDLPPDVQQFILDRCREAGWVGKVWIARKQLRAIPHGVNFVAVAARMFSYAGNRKFQKLVQSLAVEQDLMVFLIESGAMMRRLDRVEGAPRSFR
ncbi:MAG TPA: M48 family metalloprotease [Thermoanaerobaculia bacterium]|jgi:Zn-dependent protease with chaperone function